MIPNNFKAAKWVSFRQNLFLYAISQRSGKEKWCHSSWVEPGVAHRWEAFEDHIFRAWQATRGLRKPWDTREPASLKAWSQIIKIPSLLHSCSLRCHIRVPWGSGLVGAGMFPDLRFNCAENREKFSDRNKSSPCDSSRMFQRVLHPSEVFDPLFFFVQLQFLPVQLKRLVDCNFAVGWIIYPVWLMFFHDSYVWSIGGQTHNYRLTWSVISHY